jgi:hypothetical protein
MAQIRVVEKRGGLAWLWSLIALLIAAALVWYFLSDRRAHAAGGEVAPPPPQSRDSARLPSERPPAPGTFVWHVPHPGGAIAVVRVSA